MTRNRFLIVISLSLPFLLLLGPGCTRSNFTAADMVIELAPPEGFSWAATPTTIDDPAALTKKLGSDSADLLGCNWRSSTRGQLTSGRATIKIIVHQLASSNDAKKLLAAHSYPDAEQLDIGQQAYRWRDRASVETIFFRRNTYLAQLTLDNSSDPAVLTLVAARLDKSLIRGFPFF